MNNWQTMLFSAQGRIRRSQYWLWSIGITIAVLVILTIVSMVFGGPKGPDGTQSPSAIFWIVEILLLIPLTWSSICLQTKRWHDRGKSGWWILIGLVPLIGGIWAFVECGCLDGTQGPNQFGPSPKGIGSAETHF